MTIWRSKLPYTSGGKVRGKMKRHVTKAAALRTTGGGENTLVTRLRRRHRNAAQYLRKKGAMAL